MENHNSQNNLSIESDEEITIVRKKMYRSDNMPNYLRIGAIEGQGDLLDLMARLSKGAIQLFIILKAIRDNHTNLTTLNPGKTSTETNKQNTALRELQEVGLLKRVGTTTLRTIDNHTVQVPKRTFLINPTYLFPRSNDDFELAFFYWNQLEQ